MSSGFSTSLVQFLATTGGRDKSCRTLQYLMRLLSSRTKASAAGAANKTELMQKAGKMDSLAGSMAMTRKVLRFGRPIGISMNIYNTIKNLLEKKALNVPKEVLSALSSLCLMLFFLYDHYLYFERIGVVNNPERRARADFLSNFFWLLECIFGTTKNVFEYLEAEQTLSRSELKKKRVELSVDTIRNLLDIPIAIGFMYEGKVSNETMGLLGTITSLIGCYQVWK